MTNFIGYAYLLLAIILGITSNGFLKTTNGFTNLVPTTMCIRDSINTGMDSEYINRFLKAWVVSLPIAIVAALVVGPITKNFVDKITK